ncbi:MAG: FHA domain-containing protein [Acidobacteriia bacterium]|nr:FHA domain-containing protein [Terriglobia bacterium]
MARKFTIGREKSCDVLIGDESVSRLHAEMWLGDDGKIMLADRGSSNGTMLVRAGAAAPLNFGSVERSDQVRFGSVTLDVKDLIEAVEIRNPGAFAMRAGPPPLPPPPPPPSFQAGAPPPPPPPSLTSVPRAGGVLVRCECGAIKTAGQLCPTCHR